MLRDTRHDGDGDLHCDVFETAKTARMSRGERAKVKLQVRRERLVCEEAAERLLERLAKLCSLARAAGDYEKAAEFKRAHWHVAQALMLV